MISVMIEKTNTPQTGHKAVTRHSHTRAFIVTSRGITSTLPNRSEYQERRMTWEPSCCEVTHTPTFTDC